MRRPPGAGGRGAMRSGTGGGVAGPLILCLLSPKLGMDDRGGQAHRRQILPRPGTSTQADQAGPMFWPGSVVGHHLDQREIPIHPRTVRKTRNVAKPPTAITVISPTVRASFPLAAAPSSDRRLASTRMNTRVICVS